MLLTYHRSRAQQHQHGLQRGPRNHPTPKNPATLLPLVPPISVKQVPVNPQQLLNGNKATNSSPRGSYTLAIQQYHTPACAQIPPRTDRHSPVLPPLPFPAKKCDKLGKIGCRQKQAIYLLLFRRNKKKGTTSGRETAKCGASYSFPCSGTLRCVSLSLLRLTVCSRKIGPSLDREAARQGRGTRQPLIFFSWSCRKPSHPVDAALIGRSAGEERQKKSRSARNKKKNWEKLVLFLTPTITIRASHVVCISTGAHRTNTKNRTHMSSTSAGSITTTLSPVNGL